MSEEFEAWNEALAQEQPLESLSAVARRRISEGTERDELLAELQRFVNSLDDEECLDDADTVMEVMDFIVGFCSPHMRI